MHNLHAFVLVVSEGTIRNRGRGDLKKQMKTNSGRGGAQDYLYVYSALGGVHIQRRFFIKKAQTIHLTFSMTCKYFHCHCMYNCVTEF